MLFSLKDWFVPCQRNNYQPHLFHTITVVALFATIIFFFVAAQFLSYALTDNQGFLAAIVSSVLVDLTNADRIDEGLHGLSVNEKLTHAAALKAQHMAQNGYFAHESPEGFSAWHWLNEAAYDFSYAGENLAVFYGNSEDVARAWMNSPQHRANILNTQFTEIGIATAEGVYQGRPTTFVVQMFGTPQAEPVVPATVAQEPVPTVSEPVAVVAEVEKDSVVDNEAFAMVRAENSVPTPEEVLENVAVLHQEDNFIALKNVTPVAPTQTNVEPQTNFIERVVASPKTTLAYIYTVLAALLSSALVLSVFIGASVQSPKNVVSALVLLAMLGALLHVSQVNTVVADAEETRRQHLQEASS
ncbi:MAG: CAP domain-containing protein [Patescibacteria group bacterium UBA2163]